MRQLACALGLSFAAACGGAGGSGGGGGGWVSASDVGGWIGPVPNAILVDRDRVVLGTGEGIWLSTDDGATWSDSSEGLPLTVDWPQTVMPIYALVALPSRLLGGGYVSAYRSDDDGATWTESGAGLPDTVSVYGMWTTATSVLMGMNAYVPEGTVFRSTDDGESWASSSAGLPEEQTIAFAQLGSTLFGAVPSHGVSRSTDDGQSWQVSPLPVASNVLCLTATGTALFAGTADAGVFASADGQAWSEVNDGFPSDEITTTLFAHAGVVYAGTYTQGVFRSTDGGSTWAPFSEGLDDLVPGSFDRVVAFAVKDDNLWMITDLGVWRRAL